MTTTPYPAWDGVRPLDWHRLLTDAERFRTQYGAGLASVWCFINRRDFQHAREAMDQVIRAQASLTTNPDIA